MIMTRLFVVVSLVLLWTKEVTAEKLHYTLRYRESPERQSKVAAAGGKQKGMTKTMKRRSLQGVSCGTLFVPLRHQTIHDNTHHTILKRLPFQLNSRRIVQESTGILSLAVVAEKLIEENQAKEAKRAASGASRRRFHARTTFPFLRATSQLELMMMRGTTSRPSGTLHLFRATMSRPSGCLQMMQHQMMQPQMNHLQMMRATMMLRTMTTEN
jgi:hypothetical protein